jgi:hypothetical protein
LGAPGDAVDESPISQATSAGLSSVWSSRVARGTAEGSRGFCRPVVGLGRRRAAMGAKQSGMSVFTQRLSHSTIVVSLSSP